MTASPSDTDPRLALVREYFGRVDAADPRVVDLFSDDAQVYFPKFGVRRGKTGVGELLTTLGSWLEGLTHDVDALLFTIDADRVVVEGREQGRTRDGQAWPDGTISQGLFCNVFEFDGSLISRMHVYVDPDFTSSDGERVRLLRVTSTSG